LSTLSELLAEHTDLPGPAAEHLQRVVAEWQLLSDLSFADFLLWIPLDEHEFLCVAQVRPTTAPTAHREDAVASRVDVEEHPQLRRAMLQGRICREEDPRWYLEVAVRRETIPVRFGERIIAVLGRDTNLGMPRVPSPLEIAYLGGAADLCQMIADGTFPPAGPMPVVDTGPRAGDGFIRLDQGGQVVYASPNAQSAYHRMGHSDDLVGSLLTTITRGLLDDPFEGTDAAGRIWAALEGRPSLLMEIEARGAVMLLRALPLRPGGTAAGALVMVRDVTELKLRDRALLSKDATIREIHHRVKNNLQTVAALLRLQARRTGNAEARQALHESVRRVNSIALVHETLSMSLDELVDLDELFDKVMPMLSEVSTAESKVALRRTGGFGVVPAALATPLVMVLTELVHNALAHAYTPGDQGEVVISVRRSGGFLDIVVADDGCGLPPGFVIDHSNGLGLQIVRTLVDSELHATLGLRRAQPQGTEAVLRVPLRPL
jgi:two-component sensor histidine kinase/PAS domain-containing protein